MEMARRLRHVMASRGWPKAGPLRPFTSTNATSPSFSLHDEIDLLPQETDVPIQNPPPPIPKKGLGEILEMSAAIYGAHDTEAPGQRMNA